MRKWKNPFIGKERDSFYLTGSYIAANLSAESADHLRLWSVVERMSLQVAVRNIIEERLKTIPPKDELIDALSKQLIELYNRFYLELSIKNWEEFAERVRKWLLKRSLNAIDIDKALHKAQFFLRTQEQERHERKGKRKK